ncbi:hypothetical protein BY996DRAFT_6579271 [Phakopsora pachyrhizi]|uniref:Uncharacterized protein n=1 Tax=Phakopsora pachyrhizi TaxID=170000 RepID=A0AAV0BCU0_PHAPC|nr:hypothetical protein BY996DRAFT_6579271 [Phakopsora pachyrhizi]CAH7684582.1 hypothetical protein PPACK8108_LOCUS18838 [Phakopsora pachyrhizi]
MPFQPYSIGKDDGDRPTGKTPDSNKSKTGLGKEEERKTKKQSDSGETPNCSRIQQGSENIDKTSIKESVQKAEKEPSETELEQKKSRRFSSSHKGHHGRFPVSNQLETSCYQSKNNQLTIS